MSRIIVSLVLVCCSLSAWAEDEAISLLFNKAGVDGTLLIESTKTGQRFVQNDARAKRGFTAASTFKVLNTLIALEEGVIAGADATIPWDGTRHEIENWNQDQTLKTAFRTSCVWFYQELAQRIGAAKYPGYIREANYGQLREPFDETRFWLDGSLKISAEQQVAFLKQVVERRPPYSAKCYATLESIMLAEETPRYRLYAKTGWASSNSPGIGWYVGYVEVADDIWLFALNLDTRSAADLPLRIQLCLDALRVKGILPPS